MAMRHTTLLLAGVRAARRAGRPRLAYRIAQAAHYTNLKSTIAAREVARLRSKPADVTPDVHSVVIGTIGICNASCIHCPTGKASTAANPRGTMPMEIFEKIVDGIADEGIEVEHNLSFGLFGDGLLDPHVLERARYVRRRLFDVLLSVNTNGAAYDPKRHAALEPYVRYMALHCESLDPATFERLMAPLRAKNVFPKYEMLLRDFPGKVRVSVPVTRLNIGQLPAIRDWFMERGALDVIFDPMSNRCAENEGLFEALSLAPQDIRCMPVVARDLIVDCDGLVLGCCQDFQRRVPIGDLGRETFRETMANLDRHVFEQKLAQGRHDEIETCRVCRGDPRTDSFPFDLPAAQAALADVA